MWIIKTTLIVNKTITSYSTDCQQSVSGRFSPLPGPFPLRDLPLLLHRFLLSPLHPIFGPLRSRSAHMLCMRASRRKQCKNQINRQRQHHCTNDGCTRRHALPARCLLAINIVVSEEDCRLQIGVNTCCGVGAQLYANCSKNVMLCQSKNRDSWQRGSVLCVCKVATIK